MGRTTPKVGLRHKVPSNKQLLVSFGPAGVRNPLARAASIRCLNGAVAEGGMKDCVCGLPECQLTGLAVSARLMVSPRRGARDL